MRSLTRLNLKPPEPPKVIGIPWVFAVEGGCTQTDQNTNTFELNDNTCEVLFYILTLIIDRVYSISALKFFYVTRATLIMVVMCQTSHWDDKI